jgi:hypothetical protein
VDCIRNDEKHNRKPGENASEKREQTLRLKGKGLSSYYGSAPAKTGAAEREGEDARDKDRQQPSLSP